MTKMTAGAWLAIPMLFAVSFCTQGAEPVKPACNAQTRGDLWPEKTSRGSEVPVEICSKVHRKYRWEQLTIDVSRLKGADSKKPIAVRFDVAKSRAASTPSE
jgi:hypothetical protein